MFILNRLFYYGVIVPLSLLPYPVLYFISDILYYLFYYVVGYRKKVVMGNIQRSFPELSTKEHTDIAKKFYHHFADMMLESLKLFTISQEQANKRMTYSNAELPDKYYDRGQSIIVCMAHYLNWELVAVTIDASIKHQTVAIYKPLTNPYFDKKMLDSRQKYGLRMMHNRRVKEEFEEQKSELTATVFLIDQSPSPHSRPQWLKFLNQDTAVLTGTEKYAKDYNYPVVYLSLTRKSRGYYHCHFLEAADDPRNTSEGAITEKVTRMLEEEIKAVPQFWLWSHKRWKHRKPEEVKI